MRWRTTACAWCAAPAARGGTPRRVVRRASAGRDRSRASGIARRHEPRRGPHLRPRILRHQESTEPAMDEHLDRAAAIVGVGGDPARRARRRDVLGQRDERPLQHQRRHADRGIPRCTTTRIPARPTRHTRRSAGGSTTSSGTRSGGSSRSRRASPTRWTTRRSGQWLRARGAARLRLSRPSARPRKHRGHFRQRDGRREALPDRDARVLPRVRRELEESSTFAQLPSDVRKAILAEAARADGSAVPRHHRGHDARRAREHHRGSGRERVRPSRAELRHRRRVRVRRWPR